jgi:quercetin dioxygenase-like cupin family protein
MLDLLSLTWSHLQEAKAAPNGRSAARIVHDGDLRQTVVGLAAGTELGEHNAPHAATLQVLHGRVRVTSPSGDDELGTGVLHLLTHERHAVLALEDSVFLLTTVTGSTESPPAAGH